MVGDYKISREFNNMKWNNLKNGKCPKCSDYLRDTNTLIVCQGACDFKISPTKLQELIKPRSWNTNNEEDNFTRLNNMDRPLLSEDFSDLLN
jgi:hypothetical protein